MKRTLQKPIALLLALIMAFGAAPFAGIGMLVSAADPVLENVMIDPGSIEFKELNETQTLELIPIWKNNYSGEFLAKDIVWRSSNEEYLTIEPSVATPTAVITVEKLPANLDTSEYVTVTAIYKNKAGVTKQATAQVKITFIDPKFNILKNIKFNPDKVTLKTVGEVYGLGIDWNWNPDIADADKFPLKPADIVLTSSNTKYLTVTKAAPLGGDYFTEEQNVAILRVVDLPANLGDSIDVTVTASYKNDKGVEKKATATVTVTYFDPGITLKNIEILPGMVTMTNEAESVALTVNPVWLSTAGIFNANDVYWSVPLAADAKYISVTDKGLVTVRQLPAPQTEYIAVVRAQYVYDGKTYEANCTVTLKNLASVKTLMNITISPDTYTMKAVGEKQQLYVTATYSDYSSMLVTNGVAFKSSNENLIRVSGTGLMEVIATPGPRDADASVTITAYYEGKQAKVYVTLPKREVKVNRINLDWAATSAVTNTVYSFGDVFRYTAYLTETPPAGITVDKSVTLSGDPYAVDIDNEKKTITFRSITGTSASVTLTVTANDPSADCSPVSFVVTVYDDVPLEKIQWDYPLGSSGKTLFSYYDDSTGVKDILTHFYEKPGSNGAVVRTYHTVPDYAAGACTIKVTVSEPRVLRKYESTDGKYKGLIPVGNGETKLTITATTPKGKTASHTIIVRVNESPYTPISKVSIGYDPNNVPVGVEYSSATNTLSMKYNQSMTLTAKLEGMLEGKTPNLEQKPISYKTIDGKNLTLVDTPTYSWKSSDPNVAEIDSKTGKVKIHSGGDALITLHIEDNGEEFTQTLHIHATMTWWQALIAIIIAFFTFQWSKIPLYFKALFNR